MYTQSASVSARPTLLSPNQALTASVTGWVSIALIGQWVFAFYIFALYAFPLIRGTPEQAGLAHPITGYVAGDPLGNTMLFAHVIPAIILSASGIIQLIPLIRRRYPRVHRWNGRLFLTLGLLGALTGLYLTWIRGSRLSDLGAIGITLNGLLIPLAIGLAWYYARQRRFDRHQRWAIHSFLLINGVWTFRLYLMGWYMLNQGPLGNTKSLDGPTDITLSFACYLLPMLVAEFVFWARRQQSRWKTWIVAGFMGIGCLVTAAGVVATLAIWAPRINQALFG